MPIIISFRKPHRSPVGLGLAVLAGGGVLGLGKLYGRRGGIETVAIVVLGLLAVLLGLFLFGTAPTVGSLLLARLVLHTPSQVSRTTPTTERKAL